MKYFGILWLCLLGLCNLLFAQQKPANTIAAPKPLSEYDSTRQVQNKLYLLQSDYATGFQGKDLTYVIKPIFKQGSATLTCDSANYYPSRSYFDAFGNVHINHADTTNIFSDKLEYDGTTKQAYLTQNVQLVNPSSTLSTDVLLYNLGTKIGTYSNGGTLENKSVTINSKNGYYFGNTQDVYFRYNVVAKTKQTTIKSDTLRFNSNTHTAFFYGPTDIFGKDDQMYTENGTYNTKQERAFFGKNNLYNHGSRFLKGDSLFYDGKAGFGKAIKNIKFLDTIERAEMYGQKGYYYKENKYTLVTDRAFLVMATKDTLQKSDSLKHKNPKLDSIWIAADTLSTQMLSKKMVQTVGRIKVKTNDEIVEESSENEKNDDQRPSTNISNGEIQDLNNIPKTHTELPSDSLTHTLLLKDSVKHIAKTLKSKINTATIPLDSLLQFKDLLKNRMDTAIKDSSELAKLGIKINIPNNLRLSQNKKVDYDVVKQGGSIDSLGNFVPKSGKQDLPDSLQARVITAFHHVKIFKNDVQAKADSIYYNSIDSTIRCFVEPIIWSNKSQLTSDTVFIQLRDKKLYALHAFKNTFLSQVEERDTLKFNQAKGREMIALFDKGNIKSYYVDGNAESIYYVKKDSLTFSGLNQTVSGRIKVDFTKGKISKITPISNVDGKMFPMSKLPEAKELKGFSWQPKERPTSKEDIIPQNIPQQAVEKIKVKKVQTLKKSK